MKEHENFFGGTQGINMLVDSRVNLAISILLLYKYISK